MPSPRTSNTASALVALWFTAGPLLVGSALTLWVAGIGQNGLAGGFQSGLPSGLAGLLLLAIGTVLLLGLALLPTTLVALLGGYLLGMPSLLFTLATYLPAAGLGYAIARSFRPLALEAWLQRRPGYVATLARLKEGGIKTVFWIRLSPAMPFGISNLAMAWAGLPLRAVLLGSLPGMLPRTVVATYLGMQAHTLEEALQGGASWGTLASSAALLLVATLGLYLQSRVGKG
jgi:uncharacterized membrane protein YdjX (TVP38/TMEM64 family)